ncbi:MAG: FAD-dependent oxidoreductase [Gammaproteobacteria bacterium]
MPDTYDIVVIGGGINGVGVAQAAAAAGHSVLLVEKHSLAHGSSSRSSKLIHGGLRYLESGNFGLVREGLDQRRALLRLAPELVHLRPFHIPVYPETRRRPMLLRLGLSLYALLGNLRPAARFATLPRSQWDTLDGLRTNTLQAVFRYFDAQTDDAALTAAVMRSAMSLGAELALPAEFVGGHLTDDGCRIDLRTERGERTVAATVMVNAAGAWVREVLKALRPSVPPRDIVLVQGTHLIVRGELRKGLYYVESPRDGRAVFVMPWHAGEMLIGTTETRFRGDPDHVRPLAAEIHYLTSVLRHYFPRFGDAGQPEVLDTFAGLRVLPAGEGHIFHRTRETLLDVDRTYRPRVLTINGGKLTSFRATAEAVMNRIGASLPSRSRRARTGELALAPAR